MLQDAGRRHEPPLSPYSSALTSRRASSLGPPSRNNSTSALDKADALVLPQRMQPAQRREPYVRRRCKRHLAASVAQSEVLCVEGSRPRLPAAAGLLIGHCMENGLVSGFSWLRRILFSFLFFTAQPPPLHAYQRPESLLLSTLRKVLSLLLSPPPAGQLRCCLQSLRGPDKRARQHGAITRLHLNCRLKLRRFVVVCLGENYSR